MSLKPEVFQQAVTVMRIHSLSGLPKFGVVALAALTLAITGVGCKSSSDNHAQRDEIPADAKVQEIKSVPPNASVHVAAGDLALGQGKFDDAYRQYEKALELEPNSKAALFKLATLYTYNEKYDIAIATWQKYVDATNQSAGGYVNLGRANELAQQWKPAEVAYLRAVNRDPTNKAARVNYGILLAKRDRFDEAEAQLSQALKPAEVQYDLASVYELKRNFRAATAGYEKAIALDPNFVPAQQRLENLKTVTKAE
jgi:tetratricopeptide (TPR) repeat protein